MGSGTNPWVMVLGSLVAAGVELLPLPINDNLVIPIVSGGSWNSHCGCFDNAVSGSIIILETSFAADYSG